MPAPTKIGTRLSQPNWITRDSQSNPLASVEPGLKYDHVFICILIYIDVFNDLFISLYIITVYVIKYAEFEALGTRPRLQVAENASSFEALRN